MVVWVEDELVGLHRVSKANCRPPIGHFMMLTINSTVALDVSSHFDDT